LSFDKFTLQTQHAVLSLHESQEKVLQLRKAASISGNDDMFDQFKRAQSIRQNQIFGPRGRGIYQDSVLNAIEEKVAERTERLENAIKARQANEKWVSGILTFLSVASIIVLWFKMQKVMGGKSGVSFGRSNVA